MTETSERLQPDALKTTAQNFLMRNARWTWRETLFWAAVVIAYFVWSGGAFGLQNRHQLMSEIAALGLFVLSLDLILGYAGVVSLGHGAFFGLGAYSAALAAKYGAGAFPFSDPLIGLIIGAAVAGVIGLATAPLTLRGRDLTRLMTTLGLALIVEEICNQARWLTGGSDGLQGVTPGPVLGLFDFDLYGDVAAIYAWAVLFICFLFIRRLVHSPFGLSLRAIKDNALRARSLGAPADGRLIAVYALSAAFAGVAGALVAETTQSASLDMVAFHRSGDALLILVLGGAGHLYGALIGAAAFTLMRDQLSDLTPQYWLFWLGFILVAIVLFARDGLLGLVDAAMKRATAGRKP